VNRRRQTWRAFLCLLLATLVLHVVVGTTRAAAAMTPRSVIAAEAELPAGYSSFGAAKTAMGSPGAGSVFDDVVEQSQIGRSNFAADEIHTRSI